MGILDFVADQLLMIWRYNMSKMTKKEKDGVRALQFLNCVAKPINQDKENLELWRRMDDKTKKETMHLFKVL